MIIVRIFGGLGNQMFQHAAGTALAMHRECELKWDLSAFENNHIHQGFELRRVFGLNVSEATDKDYRLVLGWRGGIQARKLLTHDRLAWARPKTYVLQPHFQYWDEFCALPNQVYLDGYWQTERYFKAIASSILDRFSFAPQLAGRNQQIANAIESCNAVSVHVRRGDYVTNPVANQFHGCCLPEYYKLAIEVMHGHVKDPHFFVFSDDLEWVKSNLVMPSCCTFVDQNKGVESYNDMRLMSLCKHHIIANSSFSWWGAWLGRHLGKIVIAPKRWFHKGHADVSDLHCPGWILM